MAATVAVVTAQRGLGCTGEQRAGGAVALSSAADVATVGVWSGVLVLLPVSVFVAVVARGPSLA